MGTVKPRRDETMWRRATSPLQRLSEDKAAPAAKAEQRVRWNSSYSDLEYTKPENHDACPPVSRCTLNLSQMESHSDYRNGDMDGTQGHKPGSTSQTADRALTVLRALLDAGHPLSLTEIARRCGLPVSTTHRLLGSLRHQNLARQFPETSKYTLGLGLLEYGYAILNNLDVREHATASLTALNRATRETVHLAILDGFDLVYIDRRDSEHGIRVHTSIGRRGTPHTTGVGKALLAFLPDTDLERYLSQPLARKTSRSITDPEALREELRITRDRGYALDDGEDKDHVRCVAAPILGPAGLPLAAISVSVPDSRFTITELLTLVPQVLEHTQTLSRGIGFNPAPDGRFS